MHKIAIVDDNEAWRLAISYLLHQAGYAVATFAEAHAFLQDAHHYDVALIDFSMPSRSYQKEMDGCELIQRVKKSLEKPPILILISAFFTQQIIPQVVELCPEADAHFDKNIATEKLLHQIQRLISEKNAICSDSV